MASPDAPLARRLGAFDATMLVMGGIIGSGIFINPYVVARHVHTPALILLAWAAGDLLLAVGSLGGATPPTPSLADAFFLAFYPLAYVALVLLLRTEVREFIPATWLDGAVAGLGAAALCAAFAFTAILRSLGGDPLAVATNLAYPIGDVLLLGLAVGGTAILPRRRPPWLLLQASRLPGVVPSVRVGSASEVPARTRFRARLVAAPTTTVARGFRPIDPPE